jgi:hypothetical protein
MMKAFALAAGLLTTTVVGAAFSAPPADQDACNKLAFGLAEKAAAKKLPDADAVKVDELISTLEGQCAEGKLAEADATAQKAEAAIGK